MSEATDVPSTRLDIAEILKILPHRYPFLLVDRVLAIHEDSVETLKNVTINEPFFPGHFPHEPIMPGVLQLEAMAQTAGIWAMKKWNLGSDSSVYFLTIDKAKFRKPVRPGDQLKMTARILKVSGSRIIFAASGSVDGAVVCEAEMMAMLDRKKTPTA